MIQEKKELKMKYVEYVWFVLCTDLYTNINVLNKMSLRGT